MSENPLSALHRRRIEALYIAHSATIRAKLQWLGFGGQTLEDLHQEVFIIAMRHAEELRDDARAWLVKVARGVVVNYLRRRREVLVGEAGLDRLSTAADPEVREILRRGLDALGDVERQFVLRYDLYGETIAEIARDFGMTAERAYARVRAARKRLRRAIEEDECAWPDE
ncbi:sigma-70 family RNA polymerase sigma factor [Polyangium sorediatum]|uniref:Sigma-70 family RNA polymerase sigma factor n=1 Tax=Polyangium sorediatum TaxID=889274 RepID=A0ABT6P2T2_9BACT|nr:sigma-70 family RNA polymerase sigma factor [Polyangium sorediatum]MDI1434922.1 sigma-70 family RNA polymerase sigma factor [Polyangium sorediatum]